jgi:hypothetical protein
MTPAKVRGLRSAEIKRRIAESVDLKVLEARCLAGFGRFAQEVRHELCRSM